MSVVHTYQSDIFCTINLLAWAACDPHSLPTVTQFAGQSLSKYRQRDRRGYVTHRAGPDAVKLHFACPTALLECLVHSLPMRDPRAYSLKTHIQFVRPGQFSELLLEFRVVRGLVIDKQWVPRHTKHSPRPLRIGPDKAKVNESVGAMSRVLSLQRAIWKGRWPIMGPNSQIASIDHNQHTRQAGHKPKLLANRHGFSQSLKDMGSSSVSHVLYRQLDNKRDQ